MKVKFNIVKELGTLRDGAYSLKLRLVEWGSLRYKFDLRDWRMKDGQEMPCKGITMTAEELMTLRDILNEMEVLRDK